jgi:hypothetical protein
MSATAHMNGSGDTADVIEGVVVEAAPSNVIQLPAALPSLADATDASAADLVARLDLIKNAMRTAMQEGVDYGRIPGAPKPTLFKPGAEKLAVLFRLDVQTVTEKIWGPGEHLTVSGMTTVFHAPTCVRLGNGEGMCTTRERNYAKRQANRCCPQCGVDAIIKGKDEYGGGWVCFAKKGGCGWKWPDGAPAIEAQAVGEIDNPDLPDFWNTVVKMAKKRAVVDAILLTTGASAIFTQDVGEGGTVPPVPPAPTQQQPPPPPVALPDAVVEQVITAILATRRSHNWARMQLVALGVVDVPEGPVQRLTLSHLSKPQADQLIAICGAVTLSQQGSEAS